MADVQALLRSLQDTPELAKAVRHHAVQAAIPAQWVPLPERYRALRPALRARGIDALYSHQARALALLAAGRDVVLATPTASGKTLVYSLPVLRRSLADPDARALYVFPLKALEHDQRRQLLRDAEALGGGLRVAIYDGDTPQSERRKLRREPPQVLITTPDMLHLGILPHHASWSGFLAGLHTLVLDELHSYRGVFGAHVAQLLRRLLRVAAFHGAQPQCIAASATLANPGELAGQLTGRPFEVIEADGAPRSARHVLLLNPGGSPYTAAARIFRSAVGLGLRTIAFTKARRVTELLHAWIVDAEPHWAARISAYRSGFLPQERREIEGRLFSGDLLGVISTSALEMGIDVGGLDVCILVGYPGSQMASWQRAGRVGRRGESVVALVAQKDALDQYLMRHPQAFLSRAAEHAVADADSPVVQALHLPCAAAERPLRAGEAWLQEPGARANVARLEADGALLRSEDGGTWFASRRRPHRLVGLRQDGAQYVIEAAGDSCDAETARPRVIGHVGGSRVFAECHPGAVYLHRGRAYLVDALDLDAQRVRAREADVPFYTQTLTQKETEILSRDRERRPGACGLSLGRVRVTTTTHGFERRHVRTRERIASEPLTLPPQVLETRGLWLTLPPVIRDGIEALAGHPMGSIHAVEHAALALFPLFVLCDGHDVAGISFLHHADVGGPAIFLYDGAPGGIGLCARVYERMEALLEATLARIEDCACEKGCPACIHSPKCGNGNRPLDKHGARRVLRWLLEIEPLPGPVRPGSEPESVGARALPPQTAREARVEAPRVVFFDLETQRSAEEVGGWQNTHLMRVAVAVLYDSRERRFACFTEREVPALLEHLARADLVVGFNVQRFDYRVLDAYAEQPVHTGLTTFDVLEAIRSRIGFRLPLGHLAEETLGETKSGDGLQSLAWWREGRVDAVREYCEKDVALLRDLFHYAVAHRHLLFRTRGGERVRVPAPWSVPELIERARAGSAEGRR